MSYSLETKCFDCTKRITCADWVIFSGAIQTVHSCPDGASGWHRGAGVIRLECFNFEMLPSIQEDPKS